MRILIPKRRQKDPPFHSAQPRMNVKRSKMSGYSVDLSHKNEPVSSYMFKSEGNKSKFFVCLLIFAFMIHPFFTLASESQEEMIETEADVLENIPDAERDYDSSLSLQEEESVVFEGNIIEEESEIEEKNDAVVLLTQTHEAINETVSTSSFPSIQIPSDIPEREGIIGGENLSVSTTTENGDIDIIVLDESGEASSTQAISHDEKILMGSTTQPVSKVLDLVDRSVQSTTTPVSEVHGDGEKNTQTTGSHENKITSTTLSRTKTDSKQEEIVSSLPNLKHGTTTDQSHISEKDDPVYLLQLESRLRDELRREIERRYENRLQNEIDQIKQQQYLDQGSFQEQHNFKNTECTLLSKGELYCLKKELFSSPRESNPYSGIYSRNEDGRDAEIFLQRGNQVRQITDNSFDDISPVANDDATFLSWQGLVEDRWQIFVHDARKNTTQTLTKDNVNNIQPTITGKTIAWQGWGDGNWDIYSAEEFDGEWITTRITSSPWNDVNPRLSGTFILWESFQNGLWEVMGYDFYSQKTFKVSEGRGTNKNPRLAVLWEHQGVDGENITYEYSLDTNMRRPVVHGQKSPIMPFPFTDPLPDPIPENGGVLPQHNSASSSLSIKKDGNEDE